MKEILFCILIVLLVSCKKHQPNKEQIVTYSFYSDAPAYYIEIRDLTNLNDFQDSIYSSSFGKTLSYTYRETLRCKISNRNNTPSKMKIIISHGGAINTCQDSLYSSLNCFINL